MPHHLLRLEHSHVFIADSGFGYSLTDSLLIILHPAHLRIVPLVVSAALSGIAIICSIKGAHAGFPKAALEGDMPSGLWLTMTCVIEGVSVVAIAYKYNSKKVLHFCCPVGAGTACAGEPYVAKFTDEHGNVCTRDVLRCDIASRYYHYSPKVDPTYFYRKLMNLSMLLPRSTTTTSAARTSSYCDLCSVAIGRESGPHSSCWGAHVRICAESVE